MKFGRRVIITTTATAATLAATFAASGLAEAALIKR